MGFWCCQKIFIMGKLSRLCLERMLRRSEWSSDATGTLLFFIGALIYSTFALSSLHSRHFSFKLITNLSCDVLSRGALSFTGVCIFLEERDSLFDSAASAIWHSEHWSVSDMTRQLLCLLYTVTCIAVDDSLSKGSIILVLSAAWAYMSQQDPEFCYHQTWKDQHKAEVLELVTTVEKPW